MNVACAMAKNLSFKVLIAVVWFAVVYGLTYLVFIFPVSNTQGLRLFEGEWKHFSRAIYIPILSILPFFILIPFILKQEMPPIALLLLSGLAGAVLYLAATLCLSRKSVAENVRYFKSVLSQLAR